MTLAILAVLASSVSSEAHLAADPSGNGSKVESMTTEPLPSPGTYNAWQFLAIASGANVPWSWEESRTTHSTPKLGADREGMIRAIAGYVGWKPISDTTSFSSQLQAARDKAQREVNPALGINRPMVARPSFTVAGLVAGMPDEQGKLVRNVQARIRLAKQAAAEFRLVSDLPTFIKAVNDHIVDEEQSAVLLAAGNEGTFAALAAKQAEEHDVLLGKLNSELSALWG